MDTGWMRVFGEVARLGSFTAAAQRLGYTQSAISRQVNALESDVGAVLFDRLARGVRLTEAGRSLLDHAEAILDRLDAARGDLSALGDLTAGRLRVGAVASANAGLVPRAMAAFRAVHPKVLLTLEEGLSQRLLTALRDDELDIAVVSDHGRRPLDGAGLTLHRLVDDPMLVAMPPTHRLAGRKTVRLKELAEDSWIAASNRAEETLAARAGFEPKIDFVVREWIAKLGFVAAGLGITLVPAVAASGTRADVVLVRLHPDDAPVRAVYAVTLRGLTPPAAVEPFLRHLEESAQQ